MDKQKIEEQRNRLNAELGTLVETAMRIESEMESVPSRRGTAHKSLKPRSGEFIVKTHKGFLAYYDFNGQKYEVQVYRR